MNYVQRPRQKTIPMMLEDMIYNQEQIIKLLNELKDADNNPPKETKKGRKPKEADRPKEAEGESL